MAVRTLLLPTISSRPLFACPLKNDEHTALHFAQVDLLIVEAVVHYATQRLRQGQLRAPFLQRNMADVEASQAKKDSAAAVMAVNANSLGRLLLLFEGKAGSRAEERRAQWFTPTAKM